MLRVILGCRVGTGGHFSRELFGDLLCIHLLDFQQILHGLLEVESLFNHDDVYGVEVCLAGKASCKIGFVVGCGIEVFAQWTSEAEVSILGFMG